MRRTSRKVPYWISLRSVFAIHEAQLARFGGMPGIRDAGLVESAVVRPQQIYNYEADVSIAQLAAAYAFGLIRNHGFVDGNKRTAFLTAVVFLERNGWKLEAPEPEIVITMLGVASGGISEDELAAWFKRQTGEGGRP